MSKKMTPEQQKWIDEADYETLLHRWRFAPLGDEIFLTLAGKYYFDRMLKLRKEIGHEEHARISKKIGWKTAKN